jgi:hypothetical protein
MERQEGARRLLGEARRSAYLNSIDIPRIAPEDALQEALARTVEWARFATEEASKLREDQLWVLRDKEVVKEEIITEWGEVTREEIATYKAMLTHWVKEEQRAWERVGWLSSRMVALGIEDRSARAKEQMADNFAVALEAVIHHLGLTKQQRAKVPDAVRAALPMSTDQ